MEQQEHDIITRMNDKYMKMSKGHKAVAAYISDHYEQAVFMTAARLGETVGVSESTVVRFASSLGYGGMGEKQAEFRAEDRGQVWEELAEGNPPFRFGGGY